MFKKSTVFILHFTPACVLLSVCGLHFTLSLHFTPGPQSAVCSPQSASYIDRKCYYFKNCVALPPWFRDCHLDGSISSNVRYVTCSHGTDCHAESPAGSVQCSKMTRIDPVSTFYPTFWLTKGILQWENLQQVQKGEPLGCPYLLLRVSKLEVFIQLPPAYHENSWTSMVTYRDYIQ